MPEEAAKQVLCGNFFQNYFQYDYTISLFLLDNNLHLLVNFFTRSIIKSKICLIQKLFCYVNFLKTQRFKCNQSKNKLKSQQWVLSSGRRLIVWRSVKEQLNNCTEHDLARQLA